MTRIKGEFFLAPRVPALSQTPSTPGAGPVGSGPQLVAFAKPWLDWASQLRTLEARGLSVTDRAAAEAFLAHVNYYRLSGYCLAFEQTRHSFVAETTFEHVRESYEFDRVLRDLVTEALEVVEVDVRTAVAYHFGRQYGAFGHADASNFFRRAPTHRHAKPDEFNHSVWLSIIRQEARRSRELFVDHFRTTYLGFPDLPVWIATEIMSFGALSQMFKGMMRSDQRSIAHRYGVQPVFLTSWLHHLVYVRNVCAHHSRLWDRVWAIKPDLPPIASWAPPALPANDRLFTTLLILRQLLARSSGTAPFDIEWKERVEHHLFCPPRAPRSLQRMGLTPEWRAHPHWA